MAAQRSRVTDRNLRHAQIHKQLGDHQRARVLCEERRLEFDNVVIAAPSSWTGSGDGNAIVSVLGAADSLTLGGNLGEGSAGKSLTKGRVPVSSAIPTTGPLQTKREDIASPWRVDIGTAR